MIIIIIKQKPKILGHYKQIHEGGVSLTRIWSSVLTLSYPIFNLAFLSLKKESRNIMHKAQTFATNICNKKRSVKCRNRVKPKTVAILSSFATLKFNSIGLSFGDRLSDKVAQFNTVCYTQLNPVRSENFWLD